MSKKQSEPVKKQPTMPSENYVVSRMPKVKRSNTNNYNEEDKEEGFDRMVDHFKRLPFQHHNDGGKKMGFDPQAQDEFP